MNGLVETEIGYMPATWYVQRLCEVFETQLGKMLSQKARIGNAPKPYLRNKNVQWGRIDVSDMLYMDFDERETEKFRLRAGDLLVCEGGEPGRAAIWSGILPECFYQKALHRLRPRDERIRSEFMSYWLRFSFDLQNLYGVAGASSTIAHLPEVQLKSLPIPVPPLPEQRKIADVLGLVQRAVEQQERLIALTTELKKSLLHKLFTEGLRGEPQKQTEIGRVPESWEQCTLEEAGEVIYGIQAAVAKNLKPVGTMILTNKNITLDGKIVLEKINYFALKTKRHHETVLKKGDLLFNWRSGSKEHVGKTAYFDLAGEFVHSSFILRIRPSDEVTGRYLFYYLNFLRESGVFLKKQTFSVNAKFNKSAINELPTYLPGEEERRDIVAALDAVGKKLEVLQVKRGLLEDLFRTLLHQLMTAQIRVHDLEFSTEES
jgi:type I restriction enzyme, S subunit